MFHVVHLQPEETGRLKTIRLRALERDPDAFGSTLDRELGFTEADWRRRLDNPASATLVLVDSHRHDVGLATSHPDLDGQRPGDYHLVAMWLDDHARGTGAADLLVAAAVAHARSRAAERMVLWVADGNERARRLYERTGFRLTGVTDSFPAPRNTLVQQMILDLRQSTG